MSSKPYILAVDDEAMNQNIIIDLLEDYYDVSVANDGMACLESVNEKVPDLILLDVNMPILNGLEACIKLRQNEQFQNIPIIFLSALASPKERLAGYQAGGDDYLTKPFHEDELKEKISMLLKLTTDRNKDKQDTKHATDTAITAMTSSGEMGVIFQFMQSLLAVRDLNAIQELILSAFSSFDIDGCVMFTHQEQPVYLFTDEKIRPIEQDVLREARNERKIIEFSNRAIFNSKHVSMLIRVMPSDEDKCGRYKDHLAIFIDVLEAKLQQMITDREMIFHYQALNKTVDSTSEYLQEVNNSYRNQRASNTAILGELVRKVEDAFIHLGLNEVQEKELTQLFLNAEIETDKVYEGGKKAEQIFDQIINELNELLRKR